MRVFCLTVGLILLLGAPALARGTHVNKEVGYRIQVPRDYSDPVPAPSDPFVVDMARCLEPLRGKGGSTYTRRMFTYYFPERTAADIAREKNEREEAEQKGKEGEDHKPTVSLGPSRLYQSFREYAEDKIRGFYFTEEKEVKVAGFPATVLELQFEKLTGTPQHHMACCYRIPGGEFAVLFTCTEEHFRETRSEFYRTFESFKMLDPSGLQAPAGPESSITIRTEKGPAEGELSAAELLKLRDDAFLKAIEDLPDGWHHAQGDHFLVLFHADSRHAKKVLKHADAVRAWLDGEFAPLGLGFVQDMIIRIYQEGDERPQPTEITVYEPGSKHVRTITLVQRDRDGDSRSFSGLTRAVVGFWAEQRNGPLWKRLPEWLKTGLNEVLEDATLKGSRLAFDIDDGEVRGLAWMLDRDEQYRKQPEGEPPIRPLKEFVSRAFGELYEGRDRAYGAVQATSFVRYLLEGPGAKREKTDVLLDHYLGHLNELVADLEKRLEEERKAREELEKLREGMSEEERLRLEDEEYRNRREQTADKIEQDLLEQVFARTFGDWTDRDWQSLDRAWRSYAQKTAD